MIKLFRGFGPLLLCYFFFNNEYEQRGCITLQHCNSNCDIKISLRVWDPKDNDLNSSPSDHLISMVTPLTHVRQEGFFSWEFSSDCVFVHLPGEACVTSVECEQRVERFLSCLRGIALCCVHLTSFISTETFKEPCKTACPTGSFTVHTDIIIMLTCIFSTLLFRQFFSINSCLLCFNFCRPVANI